MADKENGLLTISEVAKRLRVSKSWIYKKCKAGIIPHVRIGAVTRFNEKDVDAWINAHRVRGALKI